MEQQERPQPSGALFLVGLWSDESQRMYGTVEQVGTGHRSEIDGWDGLLLEMQRLARSRPAARRRADRQAVVSALERFAAWYAAQPAEDQLVLSRLMTGEAGSDVRAFAAEGELVRHIEPDEIVGLATIFGDDDLRRMQSLLEDDPGSSAGNA